MKIACQTIVWGSERLFSDYLGILKEVETLGFQGVETNLRALENARDAIQPFLAERDLVILSAHTNIVELVDNPERQQQVLQLLPELGVQYLLISSPHDSTVEDFQRFAATLNAFGAEAKAKGIQVCFHNHNWELQDDCRLLNTLVENTDADALGLAADLGWVMRSETTVEHFLSQFGNRLKYMHIKDVRDGEWTELGTGELQLDEVLPLISAMNLPWLVVEQDTTNKRPMESMRISFEYLSAQTASL
ncbi:sugar phosphate isomerase/epimerase family protein [Alicyclobacillus fodiniaquatilis]|jgi:sugar phosphate isomerase/epimerase|uniref:Sugar phosphate isomerase/epimerase family protein n=1 Tax=Alicyclobacillus fodiniaquatilis TaxID=1661150 RepID=A0ABW4JQV1_9BACL